MKFRLILSYLKHIVSYIFPMYLITLGLSWLFLQIYFRLFIERPSYNLIELKPFLTTKHYVFFVVFIIIHIIIVSLTCITIYRQIFPRKKPSIFVSMTVKITYVIDQIYWKPLEYIHDLIVPNIPMSGKLFLYIEKIWSSKDPIYFYVLIFLFEFLPRLLIAIIFSIEVIIFGQIKIFIYSVSLIFITIIWQIFLKMFASFGKRNKHVIEEYFYPIKGMGDPILDSHGNIISYNSLEFVVKPEYDGVINVEEEARLLLQLEAMPRFVEHLQKDTAKVIPYVTFITSVIYIIGGMYRLIFLII